MGSSSGQRPSAPLHRRSQPPDPTELPLPAAPDHPQLPQRLAALDRLGILDSGPERDLDELVELAASLCDAPVAAVTLLDRDRQVFKAERGIGARSMPLDDAICAHAIQAGDDLEIADLTADPRTADNPLVTGEEGLRFYAGAVLRTPAGVPLGTLCVLDRRPRELDDAQRRALGVLARQVMRQIELRAALARQEVLLGEIDHRVKNSLQSVSAVVRLQAGRTRDPAVREALETVAQRVGTVAAIHEELHHASDGETVELSALFSRAGGLFSAAAPGHVMVRARFAERTVNSADAHSIAIVANEFVANAIKHAFPPGHADGLVTITGEAAADGGYRVVCADNGVGDEGALAALDDSRGLGGRLMDAAVGSLRARAEWSTEGRGLTLTVAIPPR